MNMGRTIRLRYSKWAPGATVARLHGMQEVAGSNKTYVFGNPAESTSVVFALMGI